MLNNKSGPNLIKTNARIIFGKVHSCVCDEDDVIVTTDQ